MVVDPPSLPTPCAWGLCWLLALGLNACSHWPEHISPRNSASCRKKPSRQKPWIADVLLRHKTENDFRSLGEWLGGEKTDTHCVLRSDPQHREGLYWILRLNRSPCALIPCRIVLRYVRCGTLDIREWLGEFRACPSGWARELYIGMTDDHTLRTPDDVSAWRLEMQDASGALLETRQSFLWPRQEDQERDANTTQEETDEPENLI